MKLSECEGDLGKFVCAFIYNIKSIWNFTVSIIALFSTGKIHSPYFPNGNCGNNAMMRYIVIE